MKLEQSSVDLVDDDDGLDTLTKSLSEDSLGLHADTFDCVDDDEGTIGDSESGCDLGREINVTGRVDQVDQEVVADGFLAALTGGSQTTSAYLGMSLRSSSFGRAGRTGRWQST